jgi:hypothetical protein
VITALAVENYRSLRRMVLATGRLNVVTGPNGSRKSSLYRALRLLADSARNGAVAALAREGGLESAMWAGSPDEGRSMRRGRSRPLAQGGETRRLLLGFAGEEFGYAVAAAASRRALGRDAALPAVGGGPADAPATGDARVERAGNEPWTYSGRASRREDGRWRSSPGRWALPGLTQTYGGNDYGGADPHLR